MSDKRIEDDGPDVQGVSSARLDGCLITGPAPTGFCARCRIETFASWQTNDEPPAPWCPFHGIFLSEPQPQPSISVHAHEVVPRHLGGPTDDHYAKLAVQPIEATEAWSATWDPRVAYHLGESVAAIARCGTKGQAVRDLRKAAWLCARAADILAGEKP